MFYWFHKIHHFIWFGVLVSHLGMTGLQAKDPDPQFVRSKVQAYRLEKELTILSELAELLAIPNVASDSENIQKNANLLVSMMARRGIRTQLLRVDDSPPVVYGELNTPGADKTIVLYMHYDGQPVDADNWASDPWQPVLRSKPLNEVGQAISLSDLQAPIDGEWRIYARSASDDKAPIIANLAAIDALRSAKIPLSVNVKFFLEGEEEAGSAHLSAIVNKYAQLLQADAWFMCDGPVHQTRRMQVVFGARGVIGLTLTTYGALRPLHSGHYGNWAVNPIVLLTHLLTSMRGVDGRILIDGFYDDVRPITETEQRAVDAAPNIDAELREELGLASSEGGGKRLEALIMAPALNLRGIHAGGTKARNAIPTEATAFVGFRLVPNQTLEKVRERVEAHIRKQGFYIVYETPDIEIRRKHAKIVKLQWGRGYPPARTSMELPVSKAVVRVIEQAVGEPIVRLPTFGGSGPIYIFQEALNAPFIIVPTVNHDNNQHAENENLRIQNLWDGIEIYASILARLGHVWETED
jgi:acetylornithine deacetylase/succinyl-diaminopimelate desuccinylase-like protein